MKKINEIKELIKEINKHNEDYYNRGKSSIGDFEYDKMFTQLLDLEKETGITFSNSPTQNVGFKAKNELSKIKHKHKMLSLSKRHSLVEVKDFMSRNDTVAMVKMDGLTISAEYQDGYLVRLETRGDGEEGNDVLFHAPSFEDLPKTISKKGNYVIDGEAIITYADFEEINTNLPEKERYRNPRNLAAGTLNLLSQTESKHRHLHFIAWDVIEGGSSDKVEENLREANLEGFTIVPSVYWSNQNDLNVDQISDSFNALKETARKLGYPSDGIVIKYNDINYGKTLGFTGHHFNNAIAYKFEDELYETTIKDVEWTMGKTGKLCPVAIFDPIEIDGTIVEKASLHNLNIYNELEIMPGDKVLVYKANQIIPQIDKNLSSEERIAEGITVYLSHPAHCPVCGSATEIIKTNGVQVLACTNTSCGGKQLGRLKNFVSKQCMDIDGLSEATLEKLIEKKWISTPLDIYCLKDHQYEMQHMDGFGVKSVNNLLSAIENSKKVTLDKFLCALNIEGIGKSQSKVIAKEFEYDWYLFENALLWKYDFSVLDGIGSILNQRIYEWYKTYYVTDKVKQLASILDFQIPTMTETHTDLSGKTFVITGSLNHFANRDELKNKLESLGAKVSGSVSKKTNYLVNNDSQSSSSKNKKAKDLGIPIISEEELIEILKTN